MNDVIFFEGDRIQLRLLHKDDVQGNYRRWLNDEDVCKFNSHHRFPANEMQLSEYVESVTQSKFVMVLAIILKDEKEHIGNISLQSINYIDRTAEMAFITGEKKYWGQGYTKEAALLVIKHAFDTLNLNKIYLGTLSKNIPMRKLAESLGFLQEGIRREMIYKNGEYQDVIEYGLLRSEGKALVQKTGGIRS